ncbi:transporter substrate-binding domain-containing protein [Streptococcus oralis]|uniref:Solute-binding protein family 3/N-terminal domain-containing protein n=1 Tax=Streptococcus oralis TaxID=1303 RepID=A0A139PFW8_STROR|nr:transporter substrate-binding domain-containing protein [Streptococcus oralis]KXT80374.1 hypothetical protein SORDD15_01466 [Streptococcus oralis]KXT82200.1 hypothetical protein SORDD14_00904 [Streptococcus oralis]KXT88196.1 hypothetical protein SORDD16_00232 [Streptococcus oralis]
MSKKAKIITGVALAGVVAVTIISRLATQKGTQAVESQASQSERVIQVAYSQAHAPYNFTNEQGEPDGYEASVLKAIDEKLPQYRFEYTGTNDEALLIGLESGKFDIGTKAAWYTDERAKKFIIPKEAIGASIIGFTVRKEDEAKYKNINDFAKEKGKLVPISPQNAQWSVIKDYNDKHADTPIELTAAESFKVADAYAWVLEGRYDAYFDVKLSYARSVTKEDGPYHQYADQLTWFPYKGILTYPLIHRNEENEEFSKAYDQAIQELRADGTLAKLSEKFFGEDVFSYADE